MEMKRGESMNDFPASGTTRRLNILIEKQNENGFWKCGVGFRFVMYYCDFDL